MEWFGISSKSHDEIYMTFILCSMSLSHTWIWLESWFRTNSVNIRDRNLNIDFEHESWNFGVVGLNDCIKTTHANASVPSTHANSLNPCKFSFKAIKICHSHPLPLNFHSHSFCIQFNVIWLDESLIKYFR